MFRLSFYSLVSENDGGLKSLWSERSIMPGLNKLNFGIRHAGCEIERTGRRFSGAASRQQVFGILNYCLFCHKIMSQFQSESVVGTTNKTKREGIAKHISKYSVRPIHFVDSVDKMFESVTL
jgi:hypothetical protein